MPPSTTLAIRRVVDTVSIMPWNLLKRMEQSLLWSVPPEPKGPQWTDDVFTALKVGSMSKVVQDELTDSCSSEMFSSDEDAAWSSDDDSLQEEGCSDEEDLAWSSDDGSVEEGCLEEEDSDLLVSCAYQSERWFWSPPSSTNSAQSYEEDCETVSQRRADLDEFGLEPCDIYKRRPTMYAMPSVDFSVVDAWVDRYGSSKEDFTYVATVPDCDLDDESPDPDLVTGFYIPQL